MPAIRGRTITSLGQMFPTLSGGQTAVPPPPPPPVLTNVGASGVRPNRSRRGNWRSILSPRERRQFMRAIFPGEAENLDEKEIMEMLAILDILDETDLQ